MTESLVLERAAAADADAVADVYLRSRAGAGAAMPPGVHPADDVRRHVAEVVVPQRETWLARRAGEPVGVLVLHGDDLDWLFVLPAAQGHGVGRTLLDHARRRRPDGLALWVFTSNVQARQFYERRGFVVVGGTDGDNEERSPDLRMVWLPDGRADPVGTVRRALDALDALADGPFANLVAARDDARALADAERLAADLREGRIRGPLHGMPIAVKDNIDVAGLPTRAGSAVFAGAGPAEADAPVVQRLRAAGAVVVAKTHMHELAYGPTGSVNPAGPARNPRDPERITGGSSSGSAALVALGIVPLALGTDTGCSVRTPAALCGTVGLMPRLGALPLDGVQPLSTSLDHVGLLARDLDTALRGWRALDPSASAIPRRPGRVARLRGAQFALEEPAVTEAVDAVADRLRAAGAEVVDLDPDRGPDGDPGFAALAAAYPVVVGSEAHAEFADALSARPETFQPVTAARLGTHAGRRAQTYIAALAGLRAARARVLARLSGDGVDALLTATTPVRAPRVGDEVTGSGEPIAAAMLRLCVPFSALGVAAVSVPAPDVAGLPVGVQLASVRATESELLAWAALISS